MRTGTTCTSCGPWLKSTVRRGRRMPDSRCAGGRGEEGAPRVERTPMRPTEEITRLQNRCNTLERRLSELEHLAGEVERLREFMEQFQVILVCGEHPAPVFLRWKKIKEAEYPTWRATFGKYLLELVHGSSADSWCIFRGREIIDAGGGTVHVDMAMDEAEAALIRLVQTRAPSARSSQSLSE